MKKLLLCFLIILVTGCNQEQNLNNETPVKKDEYSELINYKEALTILKEETEATVLDIETGIEFKVKRVTGGYNTLADVETINKDETNKLLQAIGGTFNIKRRAVIVDVNGQKIAASIAPFEHSGSEDKPFGAIIDNRSGLTGTGINLDSIRNNGLIGVVDIYFFNSLTPAINRIDERHQEMVLKAHEYEK